MTFKKVTQSVRRFLGDKEGASGIEYVIIAAMVAVFIATFSTSIQNALKTVFDSITAAIT